MYSCSKPQPAHSDGEPGVECHLKFKYTHSVCIHLIQSLAFAVLVFLPQPHAFIYIENIDYIQCFPSWREGKVSQGTSLYLGLYRQIEPKKWKKDFIVKVKKKKYLKRQKENLICVRKLENGIMWYGGEIGRKHLNTRAKQQFWGFFWGRSSSLLHW